MPSRTANSLAACVTRLQKDRALKETLMVKLHSGGASLADIQVVLERGGLHMSRSGIRGVLQRHGIDTSRVT